MFWLRVEGFSLYKRALKFFLLQIRVMNFTNFLKEIIFYGNKFHISHTV